MLEYEVRAIHKTTGKETRLYLGENKGQAVDTYWEGKESVFYETVMLFRRTLGPWEAEFTNVLTNQTQETTVSTFNSNIQFRSEAAEDQPMDRVLVKQADMELERILLEEEIIEKRSRLDALQKEIDADQKLLDAIIVVAPWWEQRNKR